MADRYWVGGTASWDGTAGTKWAATSGGAGGETVPTSTDDVFFDGNSTGTVTIATGNTGAKSINCTGFTGTLTGTAAISVAGSITLVAGMTYTYTGLITFTSTATLITAGKTLNNITIDATGSTVTLGDALTASNGDITVTRGTFDTANYNITAGRLLSNNSNTRTINLGSSTLTLSGGTVVNFATVTNLTFNAGTSQINASAASVVLSGGGQTFYDVNFTATTGGTKTISGVNTFNNLSMTSQLLGLTSLVLSDNQTINGTLTCAGNAFNQRGFVRSNLTGTTKTITAAAISADDCDFRDITLAGAAASAAPTRAGDCGGNSGITFPAVKTVYRVGTNTTWAGSASWALSSGGTGDNVNFPLAQDTVIFNNDTTLSGTLTTQSFNIGTLDCSNRTNTITINFTLGNNFHGSFLLGSGLTTTGSGTQTFYGRSTMDFVCAGKTITFQVNMEGVSGTLRLNDAFNSNSQLIIIAGTFNANNYNVTCSNFGSSSTSYVRTVTLGSGLLTATGSGTVFGLAATNLTFNKDTADILLTDTSTATRFLSAGGFALNKVTIGGATGISTLTINNPVSLTELASTKTVAHTINVSANLGTIDTWSVTGSAGNVVTFKSNTTVQRTFTLTNVTSGIDYLNISYMNELSGNKFYAGSNSIDSGNNTNIYFATPPGPGAETGNMLMLF